MAKRKGYVNIEALEFSKLLLKKDFFLLDVRSSGEGSIQGTDAVIPYHNIVDSLEKLPRKKDQKIILYCAHGNTSIKAAKILVDLGYGNVVNLSGGLAAYRELIGKND